MYEGRRMVARSSVIDFDSLSLITREIMWIESEHVAMASDPDNYISGPRNGRATMNE